MTALSRDDLHTAIEALRNETARYANTPARVADLLQNISDSAVLEQSSSYGPTAIAANAGEPWATMLTLPAPAANTSVLDYVVRVHGYRAGAPADDLRDESVVLKVSRDSAGTAAVVLGGYKQFNSPRLKVVAGASSVSVQVRADPTYSWTWSATASLALVPSDGQLKTKDAATIGTGATWVAQLSLAGPLKDGDQTEVAYAVRGRYNSSGSTWSFLRARGILALQRTGGTVTIVDHVQTWTHARVRVVYDTTLQIQVQQHATENWTIEAELTATLVGV